MCLDWIWDASAPARPRKTFKRGVMTYVYSSKVFGMAQQVREDTMEPLSIRVLRKESLNGIRSAPTAVLRQVGISLSIPTPLLNN